VGDLVGRLEGPVDGFIVGLCVVGKAVGDIDGRALGLDVGTSKKSNKITVSTH